MKMFRLIIKGFIIATAFVVYATCRAESIDSLKILPSNPNNKDSIQSIAYLYFGSEPNSVDSFRVVKLGQTIEVYAYYKIGGFTHPTWQNDTVSIGMLPTGKYTLKFHLFSSIKISQLDEDSIHFDVLEWNGLSKENENSKKILIYPNPSKGYIKLVGSINTVSLELFNSIGICVDRSNNSELNTHGLPSGIYTVRIRDDDGSYYSSKIYIQPD